MSIGSEEDLLGLKRIGRIVALALREMKRSLRPGVTTQQLDNVGRRLLESYGARSAPEITYAFPAATCICVNDEVAHGIPGERVIRAGDLVHLDVSAVLDGYFADTGASVPVPPVAPETHRLCLSTQRALRCAIATARAGRLFNSLGRAVEAEARRGGFKIIRNLAGHGLGKSLHEYPDGLVNFYNPADRRRFSAGLVVAIEPFLSTGATEAHKAEDGWTEKTADGSLAAQYEHTVVVTRRSSSRGFDQPPPQLTPARP